LGLKGIPGQLRIVGTKPPIFFDSQQINGLRSLEGRLTTAEFQHGVDVTTALHPEKCA
jgi:hypothetical protein